jgi:hypothetical protein
MTDLTFKTVGEDLEYWGGEVLRLEKAVDILKNRMEVLRPPDHCHAEYLTAAKALRNARKVFKRVSDGSFALPVVSEVENDATDKATEAPAAHFTRKKKPQKSQKADVNVSQTYDQCGTPPYAMLPLFPWLPRLHLVWDPMAGDNMLLDAFDTRGYEATYGTDILRGHNFFREKTPEASVPVHLVTNPAYSIKAEVIEECCKRYASSEIASWSLLVPSDTINAYKAQKHLRNINLEIIHFDTRVNFHMPQMGWNGSGAQFPVSWYTCGLGIGRQISYYDIALARKVFEDDLVARGLKVREKRNKKDNPSE